ncbi:MAG: hypothetical protein QOF80_1901 [Verrucomicrobiota bacterium]|jgi:hypothetical protein
MKASSLWIPLPVVFVIALTIAALLPLYIEQTMTHVMFAHGSGGTIEWGWKRCTLRGYCADYRYMREGQTFAKWLGVNVALAVGYASIIAVPLNLAIRRRL